MTRAMMSGDSPDTHCRTEPLLELKDRQVPCTSNGGGKLAGETVTASVLVEPQPKQQEAASIVSTDDIPKCSRSTSTDDEIESAVTPLTKKKEHPKQENGPLDSLDGDPTKLNNIHTKKQFSEDEEEEEGCAVKCLYYTLQCCECTIM